MVKLATAPLLADMGEVAALDLSTTSVALDGTAIGDPAAVGDLVRGAVAGGARPVGRWGEGRLVDTRLDAMDEAATVHLGIDVFADAGTPVHAPVGGRVRLRAGRPRHRRHLRPRASTASTRRSGSGTEVAAGDVVGAVASAGPDGLPPHVHVQRVAVPGLDAPAARASRRSPRPWLELCPDPSSLLGFLPGVAAAARDDPAALLARRDAVLADDPGPLLRRPAPDRARLAPSPRRHDGRGPRRHGQQRRGARAQPPGRRGGRRAPAPLLNTNSRFLYEPMVAFAEAPRRPLPGAARHRLPRQHRLRGERPRAPARPDGNGQRGRPRRPRRVPRLDRRDRRDHHVHARQPARARDAARVGPPGRGAEHVPRPAPRPGRRHPLRRRRARDPRAPRRRRPGARRLHRGGAVRQRRRRRRSPTATCARPTRPSARRAGSRSPTRSRWATGGSASAAGPSSSRAWSRTSSRSPRPRATAWPWAP